MRTVPITWSITVIDIFNDIDAPRFRSKTKIKEYKIKCHAVIYISVEQRLLLIDGNNIDSDKQIRLNSLEDKDNEIRAIFAVDMLNEGWDVLNLFDIVRLYDTRDARNGAPGKTTIREAQLIGRGARYYPFVVDNPEQKYVRKFDNNENEELRLIEQLHYHSASNPKYIQEIRQALVTSGLMDENYVESSN